jgi:hypothetical protein
VQERARAGRSGRDLSLSTLSCQLVVTPRRARVEQLTIVDPNIFVEHPIIRQLGAHRRDPVDGPIDNDEPIDLV